MGVQYYALRGIFALVICVFALCDMSCASNSNSNAVSEDTDGANAPGKERKVNYDSSYVSDEEMTLDPKKAEPDELLKVIRDFELSEDGQETDILYDSYTSLVNTKMRVKLPITADNVSSFIELQAFVSPQLRKALKLYLSLNEKGALEIGINKEREDYLRCLCADDYTAEQQGLADYVVLEKARYISPLFEAARLRSISICNFMSKEFPLSLSNNRYLTAITIKNADFSEDGSCDALLHSALSSNIEYLTLRGCKLPQNFDKILAGMAKLELLVLAGCLKGHVRMDDILQSIPKTVTYLDLQGNGFLTVPKLPELPLLKHLDLRHNEIEDYPSSLNGLGQHRFPGLYETNGHTSSGIGILIAIGMEGNFFTF
ncbi:MAG: hypothetical protein ACPGXY_06165 [Alphaproteobacteria bacterium]